MPWLHASIAINTHSYLPVFCFCTIFGVDHVCSPLMPPAQPLQVATKKIARKQHKKYTSAAGAAGARSTGPVRGGLSGAKASAGNAAAAIPAVGMAASGALAARAPAAQQQIEYVEAAGAAGTDSNQEGSFIATGARAGIVKAAAGASAVIVQSLVDSKWRWCCGCIRPVQEERGKPASTARG